MDDSHATTQQNDTSDIAPTNEVQQVTAADAASTIDSTASQSTAEHPSATFEPSLPSSTAESSATIALEAPVNDPATSNERVHPAQNVSKEAEPPAVEATSSSSATQTNDAEVKPSPTEPLDAPAADVTPKIEPASETVTNVASSTDSQAETKADIVEAATSETGGATTPALSQGSPSQPSILLQSEIIDRAAAATPPTSGPAATGKKFSSNLSANKKFMEKAGTDAKTPANAAVKSSAASLGRPLTPSTTASVSNSLSSASAAGPRLLTGRLSTTSGVPASGQWARGGDVKGPFLAFQPARGASAARGRGRGGPPGRGDVWGRADSSSNVGPDPSMGKLGDFPSVAEAARSKQLKANAIATAVAAKETASQKAAEAASKAAAEYNQHLIENLDAFRGRHTDPNAVHWDEMEDEDDIGDFVDFGDGAQFKVENELPTATEPIASKPSAPANDYDRGPASAPDKRLFNPNSNKLVPVAAKPEPVSTPPAQVLSRKSKSAQAAAAAAPAPIKPTPTSTPAPPVAAKPSTPIPPAPSKNPWAVQAQLPPAPVEPAPKAAVLSPAKPAVPLPAPVPSPPVPAQPKVGSKDFATAQEKEMRETADRARKRRQEEEAKIEAARKERAAQRLKDLEAKMSVTSPPSVPSPLPGTGMAVLAAQATVETHAPPPPQQRRASEAEAERIEGWRARAEAPVPPAGPKQILTRSPPKVSQAPPLPPTRQVTNENVKLLRKPSNPPPGPAPPPIPQPLVEEPKAPIVSLPSTMPSKPLEATAGPSEQPTRVRKTSTNTDTERFWRRAAPELMAKPEGPPTKRERRPLPQAESSPAPVAPTEAPAQRDEPSTDRRLEAPAPLSPILSPNLLPAQTTPGRSASRPPGPSDAMLADTMSRIKQAMEKSKVSAPPPPQLPSSRHHPPVINRRTESAIEEPPQTARLVEIPPPAWKTFPIRLGKTAARDVLDEDARKAYWAPASKPDKAIELVSFAPRSGDWSAYRLDRDRYLFKEAKAKGTKNRRPEVTLVRVVASSEARAHLDRTRRGELSPASMASMKQRGRADNEMTWRRSPLPPSAETSIPLADIPELTETVTSLLFDEPAKSSSEKTTISIMLPASKDSPHTRRSRYELPLTARPTSIEANELEEVDRKARVRLPGGRKPEEVVVAVPSVQPVDVETVAQPIPISAAATERKTTAVLADLVSPLDEKPPALGNDRNTPPPPSAAQALAMAAAAKPKSNLGSMSESLSAAPFTPATPLRDDAPSKPRSSLLTPSSTWSPVATGPSAALPIIDPHLKTVWGHPDKVDAAETRTQENSLKGIVDELPMALNQLKSLDESASPTDARVPLPPTNALQYDITGGVAPSSSTRPERDESRSRPSARDALAAVGGLPFASQRPEDAANSYPSVAYTSGPPMVSPPNVAAYPYQPYYVPSSPAAMPQQMPGGMSYMWMQQPSPGLPSPYAGPPQHKVFYTSPNDPFAGFPNPMGQAYSGNGGSSSYKPMRGGRGGAIGSGRPGGNPNSGHRPTQHAYEPFGSSPSFPPASLRSPVGPGPIGLPGAYAPSQRGNNGYGYQGASQQQASGASSQSSSFPHPPPARWP